MNNSVNVLFIGDSFALRFNRSVFQHGLRGLDSKFVINTRSSNSGLDFSTLDNLVKNHMNYAFSGLHDIVVIHIGGNDIMKGEHSVASLAGMMYYMGLFALRRGARQVIFMPVLPRYGKAFLHKHSKYNRRAKYEIATCFKEFEADRLQFNALIREWADTDPRFRTGVWQGLLVNTARFLLPDGVHVNRDGLHTYIGAFKREILHAASKL